MHHCLVTDSIGSRHAHKKSGTCKDDEGMVMVKQTNQTIAKRIQETKKLKRGWVKNMYFCFCFQKEYSSRFTCFYLAVNESNV